MKLKYFYTEEGLPMLVSLLPEIAWKKITFE